MKKVETTWFCTECGNEYSKWMGKCTYCGAWNSIVEEKVVKTKNASSTSKTETKISKLKDISKKEYSRVDSGISEVNRVLGGGFVKGSLTLIGGEPGIGKSTLILQICDKIKLDSKVLYVSGEESKEQIKMRADRIGIKKENIYFASQTDIAEIEVLIENLKPEFLLLDSIQTLYSNEITSAPGSVSQVREVTAQIMRIAKKQNITTIIVGHVTKEGNIAGPRVLEHMVDTVLYLEGERYLSYRVLRTVKNRFGSTNEIGMFEMEEEGLAEISNPEGILISERDENAVGSVVAVCVEGTRSLLVEIQSLTTRTLFGMPRRNTNGLDYNRVTLLMAVLEKYANMILNNQDVYMNLTGGVKISEPAIDLAIVLAAASAYSGVPIKKTYVVCGEVGLTGEIRAINMIEKRINEAEKLGFEKILIPSVNYKSLKNKEKTKENKEKEKNKEQIKSKERKIEIVPVKNIVDALRECEIYE